jgi:hypothetical protein
VTPDIAAVVLEPAPADSDLAQLPESLVTRVLEGSVAGGTRRWIVAEADGADARAVLQTLCESVPREAIAVTLIGRGLETEADGWAPERVTHVMPVAISAPASAVDDIDRWYREEHNEMLLRCPDWVRVRRYAIESIEGAAWSRLALHELSSGDVLQSDEVRAAMATPWRRRLATQPWFLSDGRDPLAVVR